MKRLFALLTAILVFISASAQDEHPIILDQSSARKMVNSGVDNANIDPIRKDSSRNACARIKIRFANMSRAEVDALRIQFRSNTDIARQEVGYYDNILILEVTAKPITRFYVQSDTYGQSNEVSLNLEGDCEYEMEARLNQLYSIVVSSNMPDVEVYMDDKYYGNTDANCQRQILDVTPGGHKLRLKFGRDVAEQNIAVHRNSIAFKVDINLAAPTQTYPIVVMSNMPDVEIFLDGIYKGVTDGNCQLSILDVAPGSHILNFRFGDKTTEQSIAVHRNSIAFRQDMPSGAATPEAKPQKKRYKVGDYYNENGNEGVVFEVSADGQHGKIVSLIETMLPWCSDKKERKRFIGANSRTDGAYNMAVVKAIPNWQSIHPAFKWCADYGEGWYLPARDELSTIYNQRDKINKTLLANNMDKLGSKDTWLWSSSELSDNCAYYVVFSNGYDLYDHKYDYNAVRAVLAF